MISLRVEEILESTNGKLISGDKEALVGKVVIDSRETNSESMFVCVVGENQDGHKYIGAAFDGGCRTFLVSSVDSIPTNVTYESNVILVENTEIALGKISKSYLSKFDIPIVAVTGSVGKTTTRDLIYSAVSNKFRAIKNEKNFNNEFGVPLTILNIEKEHECAVIEMGMCGFGEIDYLAEIVRPKIAVISNIGLSHIEHLGSQEGILKAKMEITNYFDENSTLIVNGDDEFLSNVYRESKTNPENYKYKVLSFGKLPINTICLEEVLVIDNVKTEFEVKIEGIKEQCRFVIPTVGEHNVYNAMSAILVGLELGMNTEEIQAGLLRFVPTKDRQDIIDTGKYSIINDVYNASPDSMIASLKVLSMYDRRRIAILGDCLELGDFAEVAHRKIGMEAIGKADVIINVGNNSKFIGIEAKENGFDLSHVYYFETKAELFKEIDDIVSEGDMILVKASRGMKFEEIVEFLKGGNKC